MTTGNPQPSVALPFADLAYRRHIEIRPSPGQVTADMEDYCHHFSVRILHSNEVVTAAVPTAERYPYETCVVDAAGLRSIVGIRLDQAMHRGDWVSDPSSQCVHVVDLALLAAHHADEREPTVYDILVTPSARPEKLATLNRNGRLVLSWSLDHSCITNPGYEGLNVTSPDFLTWLRQHFDAPDQEAAIVLRRACSIAPSRGLNMDVYERSTDLRAPDESCYTHRSSVAFRAMRVKGSTRPTEQFQDSDWATLGE